MISVVIPAFNEAGAIRRTVEEVHAALGATEHEIIVVDDGSKDATAEHAAAAGARVVAHLYNMGYGAALKTGIRAATFDTIAITDADGTYPNNELPRLIEQFQRGFSMVVAARTGQHYQESLVKTPLRWMLKWLVEFTTGTRIPDVNSGLRVFSRAEVMPYFDHLCNTFSFTTSVTLAYLMSAKFVGYVPVEYHERVGRTKVHLLRDSLRTLQYIVQAILYYNPLKLFLLICGVQLVLGVALLIAADVGDSGTVFSLGIGCLVTVVPVFCLGLLAELLSRIMVKPR